MKVSMSKTASFAPPCSGPDKALIPEEIEAALASEIQTPFYITKKDDSILGEIVVLKVEDKPWNPERLHRFHEWMDQVLSKFQRPKEIIFVDAFEYTENQKIIKR